MGVSENILVFQLDFQKNAFNALNFLASISVKGIESKQYILAKGYRVTYMPFQYKRDHVISGR